MDVFEWIRKNKGWVVLIALVLFLVVPFIIDKVFNTPAVVPFFGVQYTSSDVLAFYGIVLGSATTILALIETIQHTEKIRDLDNKQKFTPLLDGNIYNHNTSSLSPFRTMYVNVRPGTYYNEVSVSPSIDPRDLDDTFFGTQIDYLIQNVSETSAVDIRVKLNGMPLYGPFSLIPGSEASVGIYFFDERGLLLDEYPRETFYDLEVSYTNVDRTQRFKQTEMFSIKFTPICLCDEPPFVPNYDTRTGLQKQELLP